VPSPAR